MNTKHTPEPWTMKGETDPGSQTHYQWIGDGNGGQVSVIGANGMRICVCVNALAGIENPAEALRMARECIENIEACITSPGRPWTEDSRLGAMLVQARRALAALGGR